MAAREGGGALPAGVRWRPDHWLLVQDGRIVDARPATAFQPGADWRTVDHSGRLLLPGFIDAHVHMNANEFIGGEIRCGEPYSPLGVTVALQDCEDHKPDGLPALLENVLSHARH